MINWKYAFAFLVAATSLPVFFNHANLSYVAFSTVIALLCGFIMRRENEDQD